jgi:hypothetical protein
MMSCMRGVCGAEESGQLSLLFALFVLRFALLVATLGLYVLVVDSESLVNLGAESRLVLNAVDILASL